MDRTGSKIICFIPLILFINHIIVIGQDLKFTYDTIVSKSDTIIIRVSTYRGNLTWQNSFNGKQWFNINTDNDIYSFPADTIMLVRARVKESNCINARYSDTVLLNFMPLINRVEPDAGVIGDIIKVFGENFDVYGKMRISFNDINTKIVAFNDTVIEAQIPLVTNDTEVEIQVTLFNTFDTHKIDLLPPILYNAYPDTLCIGEVVTLKGTNFSSFTDYNFITAGINNPAEVISATRDSLYFIMPEGRYHSRNTNIKLCVGVQCDSLSNIIYINDSWLQKGDAPGGEFGRYYATGFQIGDTGYMGLGLGIGFDASSDFWKYNPADDSWTKLNDFAGGPRTHAISFVINDTAYIGGGFTNPSGSRTNDFWKYIPATYEWIKVSDIPRMDNAGICTFSIKEKGYIITREYDSNFWAYSPANNNWEMMPDFIPNDTYSAHADIACVINNKAYILTNNWSTGIDEVWEFDPITNIWTRKANQIAEDIFHDGRSIFVINDEAYLFPDAYSSIFSKYNPVLDVWTNLNRAKPGGRNYAVLFVFNNVAFLGTGTYFSSAYLDFWEYNPLLDK